MKNNNLGFTLIELLAVITIMGILMLVAIPAVSRTIENSRRDTFMDTAKAYINAAKNAVAADEVACKESATATDNTVISALPSGNYYYRFSTKDLSGSGGPSANSATDLLEQGGKSSWGNSDVAGYVKIEKTVSGNRTAYTYYVLMVDEAGRGITTEIKESNLRRSSVLTGTNKSNYTTAYGSTGGLECVMDI